MAGVAAWMAEIGRSAGGQAGAAGLGSAIEPAMRSVAYAANWAKPNAIPDIQSLGQMWTKSLINDQSLENWARHLGIDIRTSDPNDPFAALWNRWVKSLLPQLSPMDLERAHCLGILEKDRYHAVLKRHGWRTQEVRDIMYKLAEATPPLVEMLALVNRAEVTLADADKMLRHQGWRSAALRKSLLSLRYTTPGPSDLVRFMLRDVFDPVVIQQEQLLKEFPDKFRGDAKRLFESAGVTESDAKLYWAAHYEYPSPTQLYEMLHRLRPGRVPQDVAVTEDLVAQMLAINDLAPNWRKRLMAVSYRNLTRVDAQRAYYIGILDDDAIYHQYRDIGYNDESAKTLAKFQKQEKRRAEASRYGITTPQKALRMYEGFDMTEEDATKVLKDWDVPDRLHRPALDSAKLRRRSAVRRKCIQALHKRYLMAEMGPGDAIAILIRQGLDNDQANELVALWQCEVIARGRHVTAAKLCQWFQLGLIQPQEMTQRLVRIGYLPADAATLTAECQTRLQIKIDKEEEKRRKEFEAELEREAKEAQKEAEKAARELAKRQKELEKLAAVAACQAKGGAKPAKDQGDG